MSIVNYYRTYGTRVYGRNASGTDGRNTSNPYAGDVYNVTKVPSSTQSRSGVAPNFTWIDELGGPVQRYNSAMGMSYVDIPSNLEIAMLSRLTEQIRGHDFNLAITLGEAHESLSTIINSVYSVCGSLNRLRKGDFGGAARYLGCIPGQRDRNRAKKALDAGDISSVWLSLKYGWLPLVQDCFSASQAFEARQKKRKSTYRVKTGAQDRINIASDAFYKIWCVRTTSLAVKCEVTEEPSAMRNLGLANPASLAWELLPFSFVIDWFMPIGDFLDNWSYLGGLTATFTRSHHRKSTASFWPLAPVYNGATTRYIGGGYSHERVVFNRTVGPLANVPLPSLKTMSQIFSLGHIQNAGALVHQLTRERNFPAKPNRKFLSKRWRGDVLDRD